MRGRAVGSAPGHRPPRPHIAAELVCRRRQPVLAVRRLGEPGRAGARLRLTAVAGIGYLRYRGRPCRCFGALTRRGFSARSVLQSLVILAAAALATRPPARPQWARADAQCFCSPRPGLWRWRLPRRGRWRTGGRGMMRIPLYLEVAQWALLFGLGTLVVVLYRQLGRLLSNDRRPRPARRLAPGRADPLRRLPEARRPAHAGRRAAGTDRLRRPDVPGVRAACRQPQHTRGRRAGGRPRPAADLRPPGYLSISAAFQATRPGDRPPARRGGSGRYRANGHAAAGRGRRHRRRARGRGCEHAAGSPGAGSIDRQGERGRGMSWKQQDERFDTRVGDLAERVARRVSRRLPARCTARRDRRRGIARDRRTAGPGS